MLVNCDAQVKQLEVALKENKERGIEERQRMQKEIEQIRSWSRLRKQPAQKSAAAHIGTWATSHVCGVLFFGTKNIFKNLLGVFLAYINSNA